MLLVSSHFKSKSNPKRRNVMTISISPESTTYLGVIVNDKPVTTSLKVAEVFGKEHRNVLRDIENLIERGGAQF